MPTRPLLVRPSTPADLAAIRDIYAHAVTQGTGTFELEAPDAAEMARRRDDVLSKGLPWLVAEQDGQVLGYAYANHFRPRPAYRFCVEDSIYLHPEAQGRGVGRVLLAELVARCEAAGARQMLAVIGDTANQGSIGVHRALGFEHVRRAAVGGLEVRPLARRGADAASAGRRCQQSAAGRGVVRRPRSKALATWLAVIGGAFGAAPLLPARLARPARLALPAAHAARPGRRAAHARLRPGRPRRLGADPAARADAVGGHADGHRLRPDARRQMGRAPRLSRRKPPAGRRCWA